MEKAILLHGLPQDGFYKSLSRKEHFFVTESRPDLTGAQIVAKELAQRKFDTTLICDNMAAFCMAQQKIKSVYLFYQEKKGDNFICKIGSLGLALLARRHSIPVFIFPGKKVKKTATKKEIIYLAGKLIAPKGVLVYTALVDEVPRKLLRNYK